MSDGRRSEAFTGISILSGETVGNWEAWLGADPEGLARRAVEATAHRAGLPASLETEIGLTLADDAAVQALNRQWRGKDRPTNILSFPTRAVAAGEDPGPLAGDLVLALETCRREAEDEGKSPADHFSHLVVHGFLHLLGHDHIDDGEAERMEALEILVLADLGIEDPYRAAGEDEAA